jgi:hypothetical protein
MTGPFTVRIVLTDAAGQTVSDDCIVTVLPEPTYLPPSQYPPSDDPPRLPNGHIDHDWPSFPVRARPPAQSSHILPSPETRTTVTETA